MRYNLSAEPVIFDYDSVGNLIRGEYGKFDRIFRTPDLVENIYQDKNRRDRTYDKGGRLLSDGEFHYNYDCEENLVCKSRRNNKSTNRVRYCSSILLNSESASFSFPISIP